VSPPTGALLVFDRRPGETRNPTTEFDGFQKDLE
jgi:hypothetical protein